MPEASWKRIQEGAQSFRKNVIEQIGKTDNQILKIGRLDGSFDLWFTESKARYWCRFWSALGNVKRWHSNDDTKDEKKSSENL